MEIRKILIAEDEAIIALDIKFALEANSHKVVGIARTFEDVVQKVTEYFPDLFISSITLKKCENYFEKIVRFQKDYKFYVLFLSSMSDLKLYVERCDPVYFSFLKKPFKPETLISAVNKF